MLELYGPLLWPPLILLLAAILSWLLPPQLHLQPIIAQWAEQLKQKTHHPRRSVQQQLVAGSLGLVLIAAPLAATVGLALLHPVLELLLLTLMLPNRAFSAQKVALPLNAGAKELARTELSQWTLRDTNVLSSMGIAKAAIEAQLALRASQFFGVAFWYLLAGLPFAMMLWVSTELARQWHIDKPLLKPFGSSAYYLASLLMLPVNYLLAFNLSCYGSLQQPWRLRHQLSGDWRRRQQQWLQLCFACSLGVQLSGPWMLQGTKVARPKLGPTTQCQTQHLIRAERMLNYAQTIWLLLPLFASVAIAWFWHQSQ